VFVTGIIESLLRWQSALAHRKPHLIGAEYGNNCSLPVVNMDARPEKTLFEVRPKWLKNVHHKEFRPDRTLQDNGKLYSRPAIY
jgi:hypothetical protein